MKKGCWIRHEKGLWTIVESVDGDVVVWDPDYECSNCGSRTHKEPYQFCPNCGSDMRESRASFGFGVWYE